MASVQRRPNIPSKDTQIHHGEASGSASKGKEKGSNEGKKENPRPRRETNGFSNEDGASHTVTTVEKTKKIPKPKRNATHGDEPDPTHWDSDAESFLDRDGQSIVVQKPSTANPSKEEDEELMEDGKSEDEEAGREKFLAGGREENRKLRHSDTSSSRPQSIERQWRKLYTVVKTWWTNPTKELSPVQLKPINKIQKQIKSECDSLVRDKFPSVRPETQQMKLESLSREYEFPVKRLHGLISSTATALHKVKQLEKEGSEEAIEKQQSLVEGVAVIVEVLKEYQIPVQCVVTQNAALMFDSIVNKDEETKERYANTIAELNRPTVEQKQAWTVAIPKMEKALEVMKTADATSTGKRQLEAHIGAIEKETKLLEANNDELGLNATMNSLPIDLLKRMQDQWIGNQEEELADSWADLVKTLESQSLAKSLHQKLFSQQKGKLKALKHDSSDSDPTVPSQTSSGERAPPSTEEPSVPHSSDRSAGATSEHSASEKDYLSMQFSEVDVISLPDYSSGITEFGKLVAVRLSHTRNPKFSRFIVQAGTSKCEHYQVIRGTDLGPGGAEGLQDGQDGSLNFTFDLWKRKGELKKNRIVAIGPCVVMSRAEDYKPGPKSRRPDTYVKVKYADDSIDWLTRTEMIQLVGKSYAEKKLVILEDGYKEKTNFLEAHKKAGIHPETKQPLDPKDLTSTPWLFPEGGLRGGMDAESTDIEENEDADMLDAIEVNR